MDEKQVKLEPGSAAAGGGAPVRVKRQSTKTAQLRCSRCLKTPEDWNGPKAHDLLALFFPNCNVQCWPVIKAEGSAKCREIF